MAERYRLTNYRLIAGEENLTKRRYINVKTGGTISRREFVRRAKLVEVKPKPPKPRETVQDKRARWYANHQNRQAWLRSAPQDAYISFAEAVEMPEFEMYESFIRSPDRDIRDIGYQFFDDLEWEYENVEWGDT